MLITNQNQSQSHQIQKKHQELGGKNKNAPRLNTVTAPRAAVCTADSLDALRDGGVLARAEGRDAGERDAAVAALGRGAGLLEVVVHEPPAGRLHDAPPRGRRVVRRALAEGDAWGHCGLVGWGGGGGVSFCVQGGVL